MNTTRKPSHRVRTATTIVLLTATLLGVSAFTVAVTGAAPEAAEASDTLLPPDGAGADDGEIPEGEPLSPSSSAPALAGLEADLRAALRAAATDAAADGIDLRVTSGWRSAAYQQRLFDQAVRDYGSAEAASAWVAEPRRSAHVEGLAVDVGPTDAYSWLDQHGSTYGLCRVFANEGWHFELRDGAAVEACPGLLESAAADTREW